MQEELQTESEAPPQVREIENGIFNMVITLCQHISVSHPPEVAREYVATYLDRIADGLRQLPENTPEHEGTEA